MFQTSFKSEILFNKAINALFLVIILYSFYWFTLAAIYSHPNSEDFSLIVSTVMDGVFNSNIMLLNTYDGRYFTNFLHGLNPLAFGYLEYHYSAHLFSLLFFLSAFYYFITSFLIINSRFQALIISSLFLIINLAISPSIVHELYWLVSSYVYFYCWIFWFIWVGSFLRVVTSNSGRKQDFFYFIANIILFLSMGINEIFLGINFFTLLFLLIIDYNINRKKILNNLPIIFTFVLSFLVFILSPGIINRLFMFSNEAETNIEKSGFLIKSISHFSLEFFRLFPYNLSVLAFLSLMFFCFEKIKFKRVFYFGAKKGFISMMLMILVIYISSYAYYIPVGSAEENFPERIYTALDTGILLILFVFTFYFKKTFEIKLNYLLVSSALLILTFSLFFSDNNINLIKKEYQSGILSDYDKEMRERYETLRKANKTQSCWRIVELEPLQNQPNSIFIGPDIYSNRKQDYWNQAYETLFMIEEVKLIGDSVSKKERIFTK